MLKNFLSTGDATGVMRQAHGIKGASANVGGDRLMEVASCMEKVAKAGDLNSIPILLVELEMQFDVLKMEFYKLNLIS